MAKITEELLEKLKFKKHIFRGSIKEFGGDGEYIWRRCTNKEILGFGYTSISNRDAMLDGLKGNWVVFLNGYEHEIKNAETLEEIINLNDRLEVLIKGKNIKR